ncbi:hypothetical protein C0Q70_16578 [Pomacea canaliculata]|uniref:Uncharacterized protein n=1 Tax=Pomacea canaliculata TaxID=400727 RepID=A0A2T7NQ59_POMCA|nr:hypothetical protein C0Q70_16578 [Pomacea canaliculata]
MQDMKPEEKPGFATKEKKKPHSQRSQPKLMGLRGGSQLVMSGSCANIRLWPSEQRHDGPIFEDTIQRLLRLLSRLPGFRRRMDRTTGIFLDSQTEDGVSRRDTKEQEVCSGHGLVLVGIWSSRN